MVTLLLSSCQTVAVKDEQFCAVIPKFLPGDLPGVPTGSDGCACDYMLTSHQEILSETDCQALKNSWMTGGQAVMITPSGTLGDIKGELEKLCSRTRCSYTLRKAIAGMNRIVKQAQVIPTKMLASPQP